MQACVVYEAEMLWSCQVRLSKRSKKGVQKDWFNKQQTAGQPSCCDNGILFVTVFGVF